MPLLAVCVWMCYSITTHIAVCIDVYLCDRDACIYTVESIGSLKNYLMQLHQGRIDLPKVGRGHATHIGPVQTV